MPNVLGHGTLRVLLDVSNLGLAHGSPETRTGIFRASEALVRELLTVEGLDLRFPRR